MSVPLEWHRDESARTEQANRIVPGYGRVALMVREEDAGVVITTVLFPEPSNYEPETIERKCDGITSDQGKHFCQQFVQFLEHMNANTDSQTL